VTRLPNFLHIGPGKSGSSWLHETLALHPEVYLSEAKDLYFFSRYYDRGLDCAFSAYLQRRKHGLTATFREDLETSDLIEEGRYATQLQRYLDYFDRQALHVAVFDDLCADPQAFLDGVTTWLQIDRLILTPELLGTRQPASDVRWLPLATFAERAAVVVRRHNGAGVVGRVKRSALVQRVLYEQLGDNRPVMPPAGAAFVREHLEDEVTGVERRFWIPLRELWNWPGGQDHG
jgi:hypothetical protein